MNYSIRNWMTFFVILGCVLLSSCSRDPQVRKQKYYQSGQRYFESGKYGEAAIEFINAVRIDPQYAAAHGQLARSYFRLNKNEAAVQEFGRTLQLEPQNNEIRIELANLLILSHSFPEAQEQIDLLLKKKPNDPSVHSVNSSLLAAQGDIAAAIDEINKTISLDPGQWQFYLSRAFLQTRSDHPDGAEDSLKKVIELNPASSQARLLLGAYYQSRNRNSEAEHSFQDAENVDPTSSEPRAALVRLYLAEGRRAEAEQVAVATKEDLHNDSSGYRMLGNFYFVTGDLDKSVTEYSALTQEHPNDVQLKKDYIQLLLQKGDFKEAAKLDGEILRASPNDSDALVYRSQMQISGGQATAAAAALQTVIKNDPGNAEAHYVLGVGFQKLGNSEGAETEWREAARLRPDLLDAIRSLAALAMEKGDMGDLEQEADQMVRLQPAAPEGYALRALANVNRKRFPAAEIDAQKAIGVAPQNAFGYVQMGNLKFAEGQFDDAARVYQAALDRNLNSKDALRGLMNTFFAQKKNEQAIAVARTQIAKSPNNSGFYDLLGTALRSQKDSHGAENAFEKSVELDKTNTDATLKLAQVQAANGSILHAIATCNRAIQNNPNELSFYILLGDLYRSTKNWNGAAEAYQKGLAIQPQNPLASNNLAYVMLESGGNLDVALSLAQTARRGMPESPGVADALGWIYYQKGAYRSAIDSLEEAVRLGQKIHSPDDPRMHYRLGMAYEKDGRIAEARKELERAVKLNPKSSDAENTKKELAQLK